MNILTSEVVEKIINEQINANQTEIISKITNGTDDSMSAEQIYSRMIVNSIQISTQLSVKIVLELLFQSGLIEELDVKSLLKQLSSFPAD